MTKAYPYRELSRTEFDTVIKMIQEDILQEGLQWAHLHLDLITKRLEQGEALI